MDWLRFEIWKNESLFTDKISSDRDKLAYVILSTFIDVQDSNSLYFDSLIDSYLLFLEDSTDFHYALFSHVAADWYE